MKAYVHGCLSLATALGLGIAAELTTPQVRTDLESLAADQPQNPQPNPRNPSPSPGNPTPNPNTPAPNAHNPTSPNAPAQPGTGTPAAPGSRLGAQGNPRWFQFSDPTMQSRFNEAGQRLAQAEQKMAQRNVEITRRLGEIRQMTGEKRMDAMADLMQEMMRDNATVNQHLVQLRTFMTGDLEGTGMANPETNPARETGAPSGTPTNNPTTRPGETPQPR